MDPEGDRKRKKRKLSKQFQDGISFNSACGMQLLLQCVSKLMATNFPDLENQLKVLKTRFVLSLLPRIGVSKTLWLPKAFHKYSPRSLGLNRTGIEINFILVYTLLSSFAGETLKVSLTNLSKV